jgi:hypothetical protein
MADSLLKKTKRQRPFFRIPLLVILLAPLVMWLAWLVTPKRKLVLAIIDKTVLTKKGQEHISLNWVLNAERFTKNNNKLYHEEDDYFGFFPEKNEQYKLKGLERFSEAQLEQLSIDADGTYLTDTYGIYKNEWFHKGDAKERSGIIYGGMSKEDLFLLQQLKAKHKLIITEFNCLGSPTLPVVRAGFENMFGMRWTGWIGRYFDSFDTLTNKELPHWLINNYKSRHKGAWPFKKSGIAFVHADERIVIVENQTHLNSELPHIYATKEGREHYDIHPKVKYAFWFDVVLANPSVNRLLAHYEIDVNSKGRDEMTRNGIPVSFPAIIAHTGKDYHFYYFAGDFCDNPVPLTASYFKKIEWFKWFMFNNSDPQERKSFFWELYRPLVTTILNDYYYRQP